MSLSTEDQEPSSRVSKSQTGPLPKLETDGRLTLTQDKLGITLCTNSTLSGHLNNSGVKDKSLTLLNGSDLNNSVKDLPLDSSITRSHIQLGWDTTAISTTQRRFSTLSLVEIKTNKLFLVSTPPPKREESNGKQNMLCSTKWLHRSLRWKISNILMRWVSGSLTSHTTEEFGNSIEITLSKPRLLMPSSKERSLKMTEPLLSNSSEVPETSTLLTSFMHNKEPDQI